MTTTIPNSWETTDTSYQTSSRNIAQNFYGYTYFPIGKDVIYSWLNYEKTSGIAGLCQNGIKLMTIRNVDSRYFYMWSSRIPTDTPYLTISYTTDSNYTLTYQPEKYNQINSNIRNFQNRMNCYAYALQVYCNGTLNSGSNYYLKPGEFGISQPTSITYPANTYGALSNFYTDFDTSINNATNDYARRVICRNYMKFIEEEMSRDAAVLNFSITPLKNNYNAYNYVVDNDFVLPVNFNQDSERIIALTAYHYQKWNPVYYEYSRKLDYHYYLRNGNGTCDDPTHSSTCSKWTHKVSYNAVTDCCDSDSSKYLCDGNIGDYACSLSNCAYTPNEVRYYTINKDVNLYNSAHGYGAYSSSTGTPYYKYYAVYENGIEPYYGN